MKLVQLLKEIEVEADFQDNPVFLRKKLQRDLQQFLARDGKAVLTLKPVPLLKVLDIPAKSVDGMIKAEGFPDLQAITTVEYIEGLSLEDCPNLTDLGELKVVGPDHKMFGYLILDGCKSLTTLGKLQRVTTNLYISNCSNLTSIGDLEYVDGEIYMRRTPRIIEQQLRERGINVQIWT